MKRYFIGLYLLLLLLSHLVRDENNTLPEIKPDQQEIQFISKKNETVTLRYYDFGQQNSEVLLLLHGSPVASSALLELARQFPDHRVILPDLAGFGSSTRDLENYSIRRHASDCLVLLNQLAIDQCSVVGYSMGSGVALEIIDQAPDRIKAFISLAGIGLQEYELLGDYYLNNLLHRLQWIAIRFAEDFVPHFGFLDRSALNTAYAKNFLDTDQRPLEEILRSLEVPTLFIHGKHDKLVPYRAALAHHQIVPQSKLITLDKAGHLFPIYEYTETANLLQPFLSAIKTKEAKTRFQASEERMKATAGFIIERPLDNLDWSLALLIILLLSAATFFSEDLTCIFAGILVTQAGLSYFIAVSGCILGIFVSDLALYGVGRWLGEPALRNAPLRWFLRPDSVERSSQWLNNKGGIIILMTRFLPGTRLPTYFSMGALKVPLGKFLPYFALSAILWTPAFVYIAGQLGESLFAVFSTYKGGTFWVLLSILVLLMAFKKLVLPIFSWKGRKLLQSKMIRIIRWEFWPIWLFYPIPVLYILWLGIKNRSFTVFTASNPAFPESGFVEESKSDILKKFAPSAYASIPSFFTISNDCSNQRKIELFDTFISESHASYPIILKPDVGQRGQGVKIAQNRDEALQYLGESTSEIIVQHFVDGLEFGVFYARFPNEEKGKIISMTDKKYLYVEGNGKDSLEVLILKNSTTLPRYPSLWSELGSRLNQVPARGEKIKVAAYGTHARGAVFLDASHLLTKELEARIDELSKACPGFYFGRYDLKVPNLDDLQAGQNLSIIELNGITSESTHMYDPKFSIIDAYRILFKQWKLAFKIGEQNAQRGEEVTSLKNLAKRISNYLC